MKRILSVFVSLVLVLTSMPTFVFAQAEQNTTASTETVTQETTSPASTSSATETDESSANPDETVSPEPSETPEDDYSVSMHLSPSRLTFDAVTEGEEDLPTLSASLSNLSEGDLTLNYSSVHYFSVSAASTLAADSSKNILVSPIPGLSAGTYQEHMLISSGEETVTLYLSVTVSAASEVSSTDGEASPEESESPLAEALEEPEVALLGATGPLPAPGSVSSYSASYRTIIVSWDAVTLADGYNIYMSTSKNDGYTLYGSAASGATSYTCDSGLTCGVPYYFKVCAFDTDDVLGTMSGETHSTPKPSAVTLTSAQAKTMTTMRVSWTPLSSGASGYTVYKRAETESSYSLVATLTSISTSYYDYDGLTPGVTYYFMVCSYWTEGSYNIESAYSNELDASTELAAVTGFVAYSAGSSSILLQWSRQSDANGYVIARSASEGGSYTTIATISDNTTLTYTDSTSATTGQLNTGTTYYYAIKPYITLNSTTLYGPEAHASAAPLPVKPTGVTAASNSYKSIKLTWTAITGVDGYKIYQKTDADANWTSLATVLNGTTYISSGLTTGTAYYYYVTAFQTSASTNFEGAASTTVSARPAPEQVLNLRVTSSTFNSLSLSWDLCNGAAQYYVQRSTNADTGFTTIADSVTTTSYTDTGLTCGTLYYYRVLGVIVNDVVTSGKSSTVVSARPLPATPTGLTATAVTSSSVKIAWTAASEGASGYYVYYATEVNGTYTVAGTVTTPDFLYYTHSDLTTAQTYYYKVAAYVISGGITYAGAMSDYVTIKPMPDKPTIVSVSSTGSTSLLVTWKAVAGITGYTLMYATSSGGPFTSIDIPSSTATAYSMVDLVQANQLCYVKLQAYVVNNSVKEGGEFSDIAQGSSYPSKVSGLAVNPGDNSAIVITWTPLQSTGNVADGYKIYRNTVSTVDVFTDLVGTVTNGATGTFTDTSSIVIGTYYYYRVIPYCTGAGGSSVSGLNTKSDCDTVGNYARPSTPLNFTLAYSTATSLSLSWTRLDGVTGYEIYSSTNNSTFARLARVTNTTDATITYNHTSLTTGQPMYYKIRTYLITSTTSTSSTYLYGSFSEVKTLSPLPLAPVLTSVTASSTGIPLVTWEKSVGAYGYTVYYSTTQDGSYQVGATLYSNQASTYVYNLTPGQTYYFKVKSFAYYWYTWYFSDSYSNIVSYQAVLSAPALYAAASGYNTISTFWSAVPGAVGYTLFFRRENGDTVLTKNVTGTNYYSMQSNLISGRTMYVTIAAYCYKNNTTEWVYGPESTKVSTTASLSLPYYVVASIQNAHAVKITWTQVPNAEGYCIKRKVGNEPYRTIALLRDSSALEYVDETFGDITLAVGEKVYYTVCGWLDGGGTDLYGYDSVAVSVIQPFAAPATISATQTNYNTAQITWAAVAGAGGYMLYRSTNGTTFTLAGYTDSATTTFNNIYLYTGVTYTYKVLAYKAINGAYVMGLYSDPVSLTMTLANFPASAISASAISSTRAKVSWSLIDGALGYDVFMSTTESGTYSVASTIYGGNYTSATIYNLTANKLYYFKVRAFRYLNNAKTYNDDTTPVSIQTPLTYTTSSSVNMSTITTETVGGYEDSSYKCSNPERFSASSGGYNSVNLSWTAVPGASGYILYQSFYPTIPYTSIADVDSSVTSYHDAGLITGITYYYGIVAYVTDPVTHLRSYGPQSSIIRCAPVLDTPVLLTAASAGTSKVSLSWTAVDGAAGYFVFCSIGTSTNYTFATMTVGKTSTSVTATRLLSRTLYNFKVVPCYIKSGSWIQGSSSNVIPVTTD